VAAGELPIVLTGNCFACLGVVAGLGARSPAVLWMDAHADFDVPDDNESGFFDVFALSILTSLGCARPAPDARGCPLREGSALGPLRSRQRRRSSACELRSGSSAATGQWREEVDDIPIRILDLRIALAPEGVPGFLMAFNFGVDQLSVDTVHIGRRLTAERDRHSVSRGGRRPVRVE
jgi:arginase family enzyme